MCRPHVKWEEDSDRNLKSRLFNLALTNHADTTERNVMGIDIAIWHRYHLGHIGYFCFKIYVGTGT